MKISDNGRGFEIAARDRLTLGLISMRERAEMMGGRFEIQSGPGEGVTIEVVIKSHS